MRGMGVKYVYSYMVSIISNGHWTPRALCFTYLLFGWCLTMSYHNKLQFEDFLRPLLDINWMVRSMLMSSKGLWWCVTWHFCFQTLEIFSRIWHQLGGCKMSPVFFPSKWILMPSVACRLVWHPRGFNALKGMSRSFRKTEAPNVQIASTKQAAKAGTSFQRTLKTVATRWFLWCATHGCAEGPWGLNQVQ